MCDVRVDDATGYTDRKVPGVGQLVCTRTGKPIVTSNELGMFCEDRCDEQAARIIAATFDELVTEQTLPAGDDPAGPGVAGYRLLERTIFGFLEESTRRVQAAGLDPDPPEAGDSMNRTGEPGLVADDADGVEMPGPGSQRHRPGLPSSPPGASQPGAGEDDE